MTAIGSKECPNAVSAWRRVSQDLRQISSALMVLKKVAMAAVSEQLPLPLIDALNPCSRRILWSSCEQYWLPVARQRFACKP